MVDKVASEEIDRLKAELAAARKEREAAVEAARNVAIDRDGWKAYAMRMHSDRACVV